MKFLKIDDVIIPIDNVAHVRATQPEVGQRNVEIATKNGLFHLFPREDPSAAISEIWAKMMQCDG